MSFGGSTASKSPIRENARQMSWAGGRIPMRGSPGPSNLGTGKPIFRPEPWQWKGDSRPVRVAITPAKHWKHLAGAALCSDASLRDGRGPPIWDPRLPRRVSVSLIRCPVQTLLRAIKADGRGFDSVAKSQFREKASAPPGVSLRRTLAEVDAEWGQTASPVSGQGVGYRRT